MLQSPPRFVSILLTFLTFSVHSLQTVAQRPATGGAAPLSQETDEGVSPVIFVVGGIAVAGATYLLVRPKGAKLPVAQHMRDQLLAHNILPNADAMKLMYALNPSLENMEKMRIGEEINMPDFPKLDQSASQNIAEDNGQNMPSDLGTQIDQFETSRETLEKAAAQSNSNTFQNISKITSIVNQVQQDISSSGWGTSPVSPMVDQMTFDLLSTFNQTLDQVISAKNASSEQIALMQGIADNLSELIRNVKTISQNRVADSPLTYMDLRNEIYLASIGYVDLPSLKSAERKSDEVVWDTGPIADGLSKEFAFAVYKFSNTGVLITKGPEVEGKYKIKYVLPALKDIPNAYHSLRDPATYAVAKFPPAKIFIVVEDFSGNQVSIQDQLVDFKVVFDNPQLINPDKKIVVPLYITK